MMVRLWGMAMSKGTSDYKKNADDCRDLARQMPRAEDKAKLEKMATAWEQLAAESSLKRARETDGK
jgi:hypothetical protein